MATLLRDNVALPRLTESTSGFPGFIGLTLRRFTSATTRSNAKTSMRPRRAFAILILLVPLTMDPACAQGFKFSQPDETDKAEERARQERQDRIVEQLSTPCRANLKDKKIMVVIGELQSNGIIAAQQQNYGLHFQAINNRLRALGLRTYTPDEIRRQIAQAEIDAYFRNDPDAALSASKRLGASFVLKGLISSQAGRNPIIAVNQVFVNMGFTLSGTNGHLISDVQANSSSYSGADVRRMALTLVNEQADEVVAKLYADYCRNAGLTAGNKSAPK